VAPAAATGEVSVLLGGSLGTQARPGGVCGLSGLPEEPIPDASTWGVQLLLPTAAAAQTGVAQLGARTAAPPLHSTAPSAVSMVLLCGNEQHCCKLLLRPRGPWEPAAGLLRWLQGP
jgi:hypothetical protein